MENISYMLQNTLVGYYRTGNIVLDMIVTLLIVAISQRVMGMSFNWNAIWTFCRRTKEIRSEYIVEGKIRTGADYSIHSTAIPEEFTATMFKVWKVGAEVKSFRQYDKYSVLTEDTFSYVLNVSDDIKVENDVWIKQFNKVDRTTDGKVEFETMTLHIFSYSLTFNELRKRIIGWSNEYAEHRHQRSADKRLFFYSYYGSEGTGKARSLIFDKCVFSSNKSFDNIFFEQKDEVVARLKRFIDDPEDYKRMGTPHTLGMLFYGEPGTGKTSCIKAIANYTGKHVISIPLSRVETCRELTKIFMDEMLMDKYVPINSRIYVFEDIDCMSSVVIDRDQKEGVVEETVGEKKGDDVVGSDDSKKIIVCVKDPVEKDVDVNTKKDKLTLSFLLNMIDGLLEQSGRIIIMTTNKPDKLDKALKRPGRIDVKVNFKKASSGIVKDMCEFYFKQKLDEFKFQDGKFSGAEIMEICYNAASMEIAMERLVV